MALFDKVTALKPVGYPRAVKFMEAMYGSFWSQLKFNFTSAAADYRTKFTEQEKSLITKSSGAIAQLEVAVKVFWSTLGQKFPRPEMSDLGFCLANNEVIHSNSYSKLLDALDMNNTYEELLKVPVFKNRQRYLTKHSEHVYKDDKVQLVYSLVLFTLFVEYCSLFTQFYIINALAREKDALKEMVDVINWSKQDEETHALVGFWLVNTLREEYPDLFTPALTEKIYAEATEALETEYQLIDFILDGYASEKINAPLLKDWIMLRLSEGLQQMGFNDWEHSANDFTKVKEQVEWFENSINGQTSTDFFHAHEHNYTKATKSFSIDDVFV